MGENKSIQCWVDAVHAGREVRKGFGITRQGEKVIALTPYIWLPRLDQLMELAQVPGRRFESVSQEFFTWTNTPYPIGQQAPSRIFATLEQVWLAFVMQCRQAKVWDGSDWILVSSL
ncbi:MAG: hypothetical protein U5L00_16980 [Desulfovermiculus sp.]|nr:hypothetical protein [Desulfovermiculus sp.]